MSANLRNRSFLALDDFTTEEIHFLLHLSATLKAAARNRIERQYLQGKKIGLVFEKDSTRTRSSFEAAAYDQGAHVTYMGPVGSHIGTTESIKDTARVLGRMYDGIGYRGYEQAQAEDLARYSGVPVWNGLTNQAHPMQVMADFLTMQEHLQKPLDTISFCFLGDVGFNMGDSLMIGAAKMGMDIRLAGPRELWPRQERLEQVRAVAQQTGARITVTEDASVAVRGCDVLYTDVWLSMGAPSDLWGERIRLLRPYQVNSQLMALTGNPRTLFMHCLPSLHNRETKVGKELYERYGMDGIEVTDEVFESPASIVFDQAENRLHTTKAILVATLSNEVPA